MSTTQSVISGFFEFLKVQKRYSEHTIIAYKNDIQQFWIFYKSISEDSEILNAKYHHIRSWLVNLSSGQVANRSINRKITSLRSLFRYAQKERPDLTNPCDKIQSLKIPKRLPTVVKENELLSIYDAVFNEEKIDFFQWRDFLVLELLYNTGIRRTELINIKLEDVNLSQGLLKVIGKGKKERLIPLNKALIENIKEYLLFRNKEDSICVKYLLVTDKYDKLYPKAVYNIVKKYLSLVTTIDKKSPHVLRHSFATHLTNRGAELNAVKELLGHASLAATQVYTHNSIDQLKNIYKNAHPKGE